MLCSAPEAALFFSPDKFHHPAADPLPSLSDHNHETCPFRGGLVDEVAFYGSSLSPAQILNHCNLATSNPAAHHATVLADGALLQLSNVPEPTSALLLGLGGLALLRRRSR